MSINWVKQKKWWIIGIACIAILGTFTAFNILQDSDSHPNFRALTPKGSTVEELGGWQRVSPPGKDPTFAFTDTIEGVTISVSQRTLPPEFKKNTAKEVSNLAKSYHANRQLKAGDTTFHIGSSAKGPESVIFSKRSLLILIKSQAAISDEAWVSYINQLR